MSAGPAGPDALVTLESARAAEAEKLAALHRACLPCPHNVLSCLGDGVLRCAYRWFVASDAAAVVVARIDGTIVGATSLARGSYAGQLVRHCRGPLAFGLLAHPGALGHPEVRERLAGVWRGRRGSHGAAAGDDAAGDDAAWAQVAFTFVSPDARGWGIAARLKRAGVEVARGWSVRGLVTGVRRDNAASRRMNERAGFVEDEADGTPAVAVYRYRFAEDEA